MSSFPGTPGRDPQTRLLYPCDFLPVQGFYVKAFPYDHRKGSSSVIPVVNLSVKLVLRVPLRRPFGWSSLGIGTVTLKPA